MTNSLRNSAGDNLIEPPLRTFLEKLVPAFDEAERETASQRRQGAAFSIAEYAVNGGELPLNRIVGDLLDPQGSHGQGTAFLKVFLEQLPGVVPVEDLGRWRVVQSHRTKNKDGYVDLAIFNDFEEAIYIESKPWALEGEHQLNRYACDLQELAHRKKRLLFLPGFADREPTTLSRVNKAELGAGFASVPFQFQEEGPSVVRWLEQCATVCRAKNVGLFLTDLAAYLRMKFPGPEASMSDDPFALELARLAGTDKRNMEILFRLETLVPQLKRTLAAPFLRRLSEELERANSDWVLENGFRTFANGDGLSLRRRRWPRGWAVRMEVASANFRGFLIGFKCPSDRCPLNDLRPPLAFSETPVVTKEGQALIREALTESLRSIGHTTQESPWWPAYCYLPPPFRNWEWEAFWRISRAEEVPDGRSVASTFVEWFKLLADAVADTIDSVLTQHAHVQLPPTTVARE
jgi:hypothetical protein